MLLRTAMKCPKCNYTTFDYLDTCPRCGKDLTEEKNRCNISFVKSKTPFLLESLIGNMDGSVAGGKGLDENVKDAARHKGEPVYDDGSELDIDVDFEELELNLDLDEDDV
jgi:hypothetical protein